MGARLSRTGRAVAVALLVAGLSVGAPPVSAQERITWGIAPSSAAGPDGRGTFDYRLDPGAELTDYVGVFNLADRPLTVAVYPSDAFTTEHGGFDLLPAGQAPVDVGSWVDLDVDRVTIPPRSRVDVPFRLAVPANATPGDHAGGIVASVAEEGTDQAGNRLTVDRRVGARIYLRVSGELAPALRVEQLAASWSGTPNPFRTGAVTSTLVVRNTGNVRLVAGPAVEVDGPLGIGGWSGGTEATGELLPGAELPVEVRTGGVWPLLRLSVTARAEPVQAAAQAPLPPVATATVTLWVVPWPAIWLLALGAAVGLAVWQWRRRRRRRAAELRDRIEQAREQGRAEALASTSQGGES